MLPILSDEALLLVKWQAKYPVKGREIPKAPYPNAWLRSAADPMAASQRLLKLLSKEPTWDFNSKTATKI